MPASPGPRWACTRSVRRHRSRICRPSSASPPTVSPRWRVCRSSRRGQRRRKPFQREQGIVQIGIVGLGRMGGNIARRLMKAGHRCVVFDNNQAPRTKLAHDGAEAVASLEELVKALTPPRAVWLMLPAGAVTEQAVTTFAGLLRADDVLIDGGNSYYKDDIRRARTLAGRGIHYVDCGTSGGIWGIERGYCMMIGGARAAVDRLDPIFAAL